MNRKCSFSLNALVDSSALQCILLVIMAIGLGNLSPLWGCPTAHGVYA